MSHNLYKNFGNWCIFPENKLIYQGKWLNPQIVSGAEIKFITFPHLKLSLQILRVNYDSCTSDSHDCIFQNFVMKFMYKKDTNITTCIIIFIIKKIVMLNLFREAGKKLFPKKIQTPKKYPNHPKIAFFDPKFTFRFHIFGKAFQKKYVFLRLP